jgi:hypothetical protein
MSDDCSCVYVDDYNKPSFIYARTRKARKEHICCDCERIIQIGETYEIAKGKWDLSMETYKTCLDCLSLRETFFCKGFLYGGIREYVAYHIGEMSGQISSDCIAKLTPIARKWVCEEIEEYWERYYDE